MEQQSNRAHRPAKEKKKYDGMIHAKFICDPACAECF